MPRTPATARSAAARNAARAAAAAQTDLDTAVLDAVAETAPAPAVVAPGAGGGARPKGAPAKPAAAASLPIGELRDVPLALIDESEHNPRRSLTELQPLMHSIRDRGIIEPLVVTPTPDGRYRIVAGHRRAAAARLAMLASVPCIVRAAGDDDVDEMVARMIENLQRVDLDPLEEARGYARLKDLGMKQKAIAEAVGRNQGHVSKRLTLLSLPESLAVRVGRPDDDGGVTLEQAVAVGRLPGRLQVAIAEAVHADDDAKFSGGWQLDQVIAREARAAKAAGEIVDVVKALRASKVLVLNVDGDVIAKAPTYDAESGPYPVFRLDVDTAEHAKLPCHAVVLLAHPHGGGADLVGQWTQAVCTDPSAHGAETPAASSGARRGPGEVSVRSVPDPERDARDAALEAARAAREAFTTDLVHGKLAPVLRDYVLRGQIRDAVLGREYYLASVEVGAALAVAAEADDLVELLARGVTGSGDKLVRAALAARLDVDLDAVWKAIRDAASGRPGSWAPDVVDTVAFFELAGKCGYTPAEVEVGALEAIAAACPDPVRAALLEADLIAPVEEPAGDPVDFDAARRALGVTDDAIARANADGIAADAWLEPGRAIPTGRCSVCRGAAKALLSGTGRHAPGGGSVRKGHEACPGGALLTLTDMAAPAEAVGCPTCAGVGRVGDPAEADLSKLDRCPDCAGTGLVPAPVPAEAAVAG